MNTRTHQIHLSSLKPFFSTWEPVKNLHQSWVICKNPSNTKSQKMFLTSRGKVRKGAKGMVARASNPDANANTKIADEEAEKRAREFFEKVKAAEHERVKESDRLIRKANIQLEREHIMAEEWAKPLQKLQGKLKGTPWDPEPSHDIPFSEFWKLLEKKRVRYMEYGDLGQSVAVVLPYYKDAAEVTGRAEESQRNSEREIVFRRHVVQQMPIDCWTDIWQKLHQQLINVEVVNMNSIPSQIYPTIAVAVVWAMRLGLIIFLYLKLDSFLEKIYRRKRPERPRFRRPRLSDSFGDLGFLGQSRARFISAEESTGVTFDDFAGQEYVKRELQEVVKILKESQEFEAAGIYCPKGVLLFGPPGTGKTLLAKAIAGEAGIPFFSASGSEFVEMFVGVAAARVRDLFARARQFAPAIIFIDEIDAIGAKRGGADVGGGGVEREQGLIQILTEMDGFKTSTAKVLVVGATNRLDMLDPALLRKGRFDKVISIGLPSEEGRLAILRVHARNKSFRSEEEKENLLKEVSKLADDFSGAELQNVLNEAGILCARKDKDFIEREEIMEALKRQEGTFSTGQEDYVEIPPELKMRLAYREAAIAILACYFPNRHRPFIKTDIRTVDSHPNMEYNEPRNHIFARKSDYVNSIVRACAPRLIEEEIFGTDHLSWLSGAALSEAGVYAEYLILQTGMTALGKIFYKTQEDVMVHLGPKIEALRDEYVRYAVEKCSSVLKEYRSAVETITDVLLEKDEITADEIWDIFRRAPRISQPPVKPVDEYGALVYVGRWGIHGVSLPGRVTYNPGNVGYATFGAPRPQQGKVISDDTWKMIDAMREKSIEEIARKFERKEESPEVLMAEHFL
eukprot:Gb_35906 [translate_table: standard]